MYRFTRVHCGIFAVFAGELKKVPAHLSYTVREVAKTYVDSASKTIEFLKGEDPNEDPALRNKRRQHRTMYQAVLREQATKAQAEAAQKHANLSWKERLQLSFKEAKESVAQMTSVKAGAMALLQHCTASHAAEVALEQNIDVKNVQMVFEKTVANNSVGYEEVVVGYIDAPASSHEEVMAFAEKLHKACPVAKNMHIEWRQGSATTYGQKEEPVRRAEGLQRDMNPFAGGAKCDAAPNGSLNSDSSLAANGTSTVNAESVPPGIPGSRRSHSLKSSWAKRESRTRSLWDDDDGLHLPGLKKKESPPICATSSDSDPKHSSMKTGSACQPPSTPPPLVPAAAAQPASSNDDPGVSSSSVKSENSST
ncbi:hypothetical protein JKF63_01741 [Porcisia hertigi]|uniref:Uncharacterized protein n=1 Tax=Porcisia hertigi TaxID=2761500 RepID=A0A836L0N5_9TRYP|nr:hypothetical protein JKF63_01741 [Porcisia hertigi]